MIIKRCSECMSEIGSNAARCASCRYVFKAMCNESSLTPASVRGELDKFKFIYMRVIEALDICPTVGKEAEHITTAIGDLKAKAARLEEHAVAYRVPDRDQPGKHVEGRVSNELARHIYALIEKAAKWDAMQQRLDKHPYNPNNPNNLIDGVGCVCKQIHNGVCTACGKDHTLELAGGMKVVPDSRVPNNHPPIALMPVPMPAGYELKVWGTGQGQPVVRTCVTHQLDNHGTCVRCGKDRAFAKKHSLLRPKQDRFVNERLSEQGKGIRAHGGEYTEPGEVVVACDHGWD